MSAAEIARALGDARQTGLEWKCLCPLCNGRLALRDGTRGLLAKCWSGCEPRDVYVELRRLGHLSADPPPPLSPEEIACRAAAAERKRRRKIAEARWLWDTGSPIKETLGDTYLRARGLDVFSPYLSDQAASVLRFLPRAWHSPGVFRPAIIAAIEHVHLGFIGAHITFLAIDGSGKASLDPPRKIWGACKGGAVRLGEPKANRWMIVAEGIETAMSVAIACALPTWAALSADGITSLVLPTWATTVVIAADADRHNVGQRAAQNAAQRWLSEGRRVRIAVPAEMDSDFNGVLIGRAAAVIEEGRNVAA